MKADEMEGNRPPPLLVIILILISLLVFGVMTLVLFWFASINIISNIISYPPSISFHKGGLYGLGSGVGMFLFLGTMIWETILKRSFSEKVTKIIHKIIIICLVITLGLPHIVHFPYSQHLKSKGYITCNEMSERWFHDLTVVYVKSDAICEKLIADKAKSEEF